MAVLASWLDDELAAGQTTVHTHWRDDKLAAGWTTVLACWCDDEPVGGSDNGAHPLAQG